MGYFKDTLKGLSWMGALRGAGRLMAVIRIAVLARLLAPQQFGLFAIASLAIALLEMLTETGINVFFIQEKDRVKTYLDTAWMISIVRGFVIFLVSWFPSIRIMSVSSFCCCCRLLLLFVEN